jgi:hypothetical protein
MTRLKVTLVPLPFDGALASKAVRDELKIVDGAFVQIKNSEGTACVNLRVDKLLQDWLEHDRAKDSLFISVIRAKNLEVSDGDEVEVSESDITLNLP